ncbi:hypothetical protein [uncultured Sneathiella sp.]|uniref:hypothetical protein n=1 Tax=uncultured Sneathiella sp. TaxID=879315 RepID=UPI0030EEF938|tara:strand:+ start:65 stop:256 length:192 start_codon:yes stop_codon:yes gene_type:complete
MPMQSDIERLKNIKKRQHQRVEGEKALKRGTSEPHGSDLATTVTANREKAAHKASIDQLKRNR